MKNNLKLGLASQGLADTLQTFIYFAVRIAIIIAAIKYILS